MMHIAQRFSEIDTDVRSSGPVKEIQNDYFFSPLVQELTEHEFRHRR